MVLGRLSHARVLDRALVHQLIRELNPKFSVLKTLCHFSHNFQPPLKRVNSFLATRLHRMLTPSALLNLRSWLLVLQHRRRSLPHPLQPHRIAPNTTTTTTTTVMEAAAAAMATPCHTSPLLLRGGHGAMASMHPGRAPLDPAFLAHVLLRCWPTPIKHITQRSCLRLFILHPRIPRGSSRLCKPRLFNNRATKLTGIWTVVPCHT
jgi:hypothetical protein